jgi:hypothetical protein
VDERQKWAKKVSEVFNTMPRDGTRTLWLPRTSIENRLAEVLDNRGVHICLDGPTGTGKTSLALTLLNRLKIKYKLIQVTKSMGWSEFCKRLISTSSNKETSVSAEVEFGVDHLIPQGKLKLSIGTKGRASDKLELLEAIASKWTEHDVCQLLADKNVLLLIDDFERASEEFIRNVSDMCKLLTQSYQNPYAKIVVVGTDDICRRLYDANPSLESRLEQISLGTLPTRNDSWRFLSMGFDVLRLRHPANERFTKKEELLECVQAVYEAADGLPKSLNELGWKISLKGLGRTRISPTDIKEITAQMPLDNLRKYKSEYPKIIKCFTSNPIVRAVLQHLYHEGIGQIHNWSDVEAALAETYSEEQVEHAICELIDAKFLVRTGIHGDILFVTSPPLAHTLGVLVTYPDKYKAPALFRKGQLVFPFFKKSDEQLFLPYAEDKDS